MKSYQRADRVSGLIRQTLSELLAKKIKDPRLAMTVVSDVKMSADLRLARIYVTHSSAAEASRDETLAALRRAAGYIKRILAPELGLRYMPEIEFFYDHSFEYGRHIDNLLKSVKSNDAIDHSPDTEKP